MFSNKPKFARGQVIVGSLAQTRAAQCDRVICDAGRDYMVVRHICGSSGWALYQPDFVSGKDFVTIYEKLYSDRWVYFHEQKIWFPVPNEGVTLPEIMKQEIENEARYQQLQALRY